MATITKLFPTGILQSSVEFDEVTSIGGSAIGGSILFPTSSYLASGTALTLGVTCTVECWFRTTSNPATSKIVLVAGNGNRGISIYNGVYGQTGYSATKFTVDWETAGNIEFTVPTMSANTWYHLAVTQTALGVMTLWLNGARSSTGTLTPNWSFISNAYRVGAWSSQSIYSQGVYISNVRITTTAVYDVTQTSITVPTSPLTAIAGTQLLLNMSTSGSAYTDSSTNAITMTATDLSGQILVDFTGVETATVSANCAIGPVVFTLTATNSCGTTSVQLTDGACFPAGTKVHIADGSTKNIEDVRVGDLVIGAFGEHNPVLALQHVLVGNSKMYKINDEHVTTDHHPHVSLDKKFYTMDIKTIENNVYGTNMLVINAEGKAESRHLDGLNKGRVQKLALGLNLKTIDGSRILTKLEEVPMAFDTPLYNLVTGGSHTYHADGYAVTGWPSERDFDYDTWAPK